jgi:hypothetical protein
MSHLNQQELRVFRRELLSDTFDKFFPALVSNLAFSIRADTFIGTFSEEFAQPFKQAFLDCAANSIAVVAFTCPQAGYTFGR